VFDRRVDGTAEVFGVSGSLYRSALIMFDRRTQSLWPQPLGTAVLGPLLGTELTVLASSLLPWSQVRDAHPSVEVVMGSELELGETVNPYEGYDVSGDPFLFRGEVDDRLPAFTRIVGVTFAEQSRAWTYDSLRRSRTAQATVGGQPVVVLWPRAAPPPWRPLMCALDGTSAAPRCTTPGSTAVAHQDAFWFAWAAFQPQTGLVR
jgi:hypothetical protein